MKSLSAWVRSALFPLAFIACTHVGTTAFGQVIAVYQAEYQPRHTGRIYRDRADNSVVVLAEPFLDGEGYLGFGPWTPNLPPYTDLTAWFRIAKVGTYGVVSVSIEVYDFTANRVLARRNLKIDSHRGYLDHHLDFEVEPGHLIEFRTYYWGTTQVKFDKVTVEYD